MKRLVLIITGDRHATDGFRVRATWRALIYRHLTDLLNRYDTIVLIHGACGEDVGQERAMKGLDAIANAIGNSINEVSVVPMPADWATGTKAGPMRNARMLEIQALLMGHGYDGLVHAYHDDLTNGSKGTLNCVRESRRRGVDTKVFRSDGTEYGNDVR